MDDEADRRARRADAYENPRPEVQALVPQEARRILDAGCSSGALGAALKARQGAEVLGLEIDPVYAQRARERLDVVWTADLEQWASDPAAHAEVGRFDCVVAADVLEHLRDPWATARSLSELLVPGGVLVVSLPNVRYWETFWHLGVRGTWPRHGQGIFDATHLRWFTVADAMGLLAQAGVEPETVRRMYRLRASGSRWDSRLQWLERTPLRPFFTFQAVIAARRPN